MLLGIIEGKEEALEVKDEFMENTLACESGQLDSLYKPQSGLQSTTGVLREGAYK